jgi:hypothetical protein
MSIFLMFNNAILTLCAPEAVVKCASQHCTGVMSRTNLELSSGRSSDARVICFQHVRILL